jgi:hypothetical protein
MSHPLLDDDSPRRKRLLRAIDGSSVALGIDLDFKVIDRTALGKQSQVVSRAAKGRDCAISGKAESDSEQPVKLWPERHASGRNSQAS